MQTATRLPRLEAQLHIVLSDWHADQIRRLAHRDGLSVSSWLRQLVLRQLSTLEQDPAASR